MAKKKATAANAVDDGGGTSVIDDDAAVNAADVAEADTDGDDQGGLSDIKARHYEQIVRLNVECCEAGFDYENKKAIAAAAKKNHELLQAKLNRLIADGANPQMELPFDEDEDAAEDWKDVAISDVLELTDKQFEKLEDAGVRTVGQFEHLRSGQMTDYPDGLRSLKGVGEKTVDAWENQIVEWLSENAREASSDKGVSEDVGAEPEAE